MRSGSATGRSASGSSHEDLGPSPCRAARGFQWRPRITAMTLEEALDRLQKLGNPTTRKHNTKHGAGDHQFGVKHGDIRQLAKTIKVDSKLAMALWGTGNVDAQLLATLLIQPKDLSAEEMDRMVRSVAFAHVADWLIS